jgi:hypothetical protein
MKLRFAVPRYNCDRQSSDVPNIEGLLDRVGEFWGDNLAIIYPDRIS